MCLSLWHKQSQRSISFTHNTYASTTQYLLCANSLKRNQIPTHSYTTRTHTHTPFFIECLNKYSLKCHSLPFWANFHLAPSYFEPSCVSVIFFHFQFIFIKTLVLVGAKFYSTPERMTKWEQRLSGPRSTFAVGFSYFITLYSQLLVLPAMFEHRNVLEWFRVYFGLQVKAKQRHILTFSMVSFIFFFPSRFPFIFYGHSSGITPHSIPFHHIRFYQFYIFQAIFNINIYSHHFASR